MAGEPANPQAVADPVDGAALRADEALSLTHGLAAKAAGTPVGGFALLEIGHSMMQ